MGLFKVVKFQTNVNFDIFPGSGFPGSGFVQIYEYSSLQKLSNSGNLNFDSLPGPFSSGVFGQLFFRLAGAAGQESGQHTNPKPYSQNRLFRLMQYNKADPGIDKHAT